MTFRKQTSWLPGKQASPSGLALASLATTLAVILSACSSSVTIPKATASGPQLYMTPTIYEGAPAVRYTISPATISIDDAATIPTFAQKTYSAQTGAQVNYSGDIASPTPALARGLKELELAYPQAGSGWAVELAGQSGGLEQLTGQPFVPMVPAVTCPSMSSPETFLFVTLPEPLGDWNPALETAYGSVSISASGSAVTFAANKYNLAGTQSNATASSQTGTCSSTVYGNTVAVPANPTITIVPGANPVNGRQAMIGIGPSGLLIEDNGSAIPFPPTGTFYEDVLGAGTGAIGLPQPTSLVDTSTAASSLLSAQYLGFFYGSGSSGSATNGFSSVASFGFSSLPANCNNNYFGIPATDTIVLFGGDFANNNPAAGTVQANGGYGNCDVAIDFGAQGSSTNGLFSGAKVYVGSSFAANTTGKTYSFPAVAIAGQLPANSTNGKYAIFLVGEDTVGSPNQAWGIYLLQSN